jgi:hypothetical protein
MAKGLSSAVVSFVVVGLALPFLLEFFSQQISSYVQLPPGSEIWAAFLLIGALFGITSFLQNAYSKGDYRWLLGKLGRGLASLALYIFVFSLLPGTFGSAGIQTSDLLYLIYLAVALSYGYLILDFFQARRERGAARPQDASPLPQEGGAVSP